MIAIAVIVVAAFTLPTLIGLAMVRSREEIERNEVLTRKHRERTVRLIARQQERKHG